jgi:hypothetical protein
MSDYDLSLPPLGSSLGRKPRLSLGDYQLQLDPEIRALMADLRSGRITPKLRETWLNPDWDALDRHAPNKSALAGGSAGRCAWSAPGPGPDTPGAATVGDAMKAVYRVPCVRRFVDQRLDWLQAQGQSIWDHASTGGKVGIASGGIVVVGGAVVAGIALGPLNGVDLPVPKIPGLSARISLGKEALPAGYSHLPADGAWGFQLNLDMTEIFNFLK